MPRDTADRLAIRDLVENWAVYRRLPEAIAEHRFKRFVGSRLTRFASRVFAHNIAGIGGLKPQLTRTEHPVLEMTNEAFRMLVDRIKGAAFETGRNIVFTPALVVGDSCAPLR